MRCHGHTTALAAENCCPKETKYSASVGNVRSDTKSDVKSEGKRRHLEGKRKTQAHEGVLT
jgi:hypothetical protein